MLRTNRLIAPVGMALVSLSLAAVPFLFNAAGTDLHFGSRLMSVTSAWNQIANVFVAVYQPSSAAQLLALDYGTEDRGGSPAEKCSGHQEVAACLDSVPEFQESEMTFRCVAPDPSVELSGTPRKPDARLQPGRAPKGTPAGVVKPCRAGVAINISGKGAPVPPTNLPRIDVLKIIETALNSDRARRIIESNFAEYRIQPKLELTRLANRSAAAAYRVTVKRGASGCEVEIPAPRPDPETREKLRKGRVVSAFESQS